MSISAFGVEHVEVSKGAAFTEKGRKQASKDRELRRSVSRGDRVGAATLGGPYTAMKAPKGKKLASFKSHAKYQTGGSKIPVRRPHRSHGAAFASAKKEQGW